MNKTKFSVAISCYNIEKYVERAMNSVLNQTFTDYELIIVDDCSTDKTMEIVKNIEKEDIKIYNTDKNSGTAGATRNIAIDKANGEYIIFLDGDDCLYDENTLKNINENCLISINDKYSWHIKFSLNNLLKSIQFKNELIFCEKL